MHPSPETLYENCLGYCGKIRNPVLRDCCGRILRDYHDKLISCPGSPGNHHNYPGGLIQHIHGVTRNAWAILQAYPDLEVDPDLVLFGGLVHDIGKTVTYGMENDEPVFRDTLMRFWVTPILACTSSRPIWTSTIWRRT